MEVADDVIGPGGRLLMPAGTVLTEKHIQAFESWNVPSASIVSETDGNGASGVAPPPLDPAHERRIRDRFRHNDLEHPFIACLLQEILGRAARTAAPDAHES